MASQMDENVRYFFQSLFRSLARASQRLRRHRQHQLELHSQCLPDTHRLATKPNAESTRSIVQIALVAAHSGRGRDAVTHRVDHELRPALTPEIGRRFGTVHAR